MPLPRGAKLLKVMQRTEGAEVVYSTRQTTWGGWVLLTFISIHCYLLFVGLSADTLELKGKVVPHPSHWHLLGLVALYSIFFFAGFAFTLSRYTLRLSSSNVTVTYRVFPYVGWTWRLQIKETMRVSLAFRGARSSHNRRDAIVIASGDKEISFGPFLARDVKEYLASAIYTFYNDAAVRSDGIDMGHVIDADKTFAIKDLAPGAYWYKVPGKSPELCEKRIDEDFVRFTNGRHQSWANAGERFDGPLQAPQQ